MKTAIGSILIFLHLQCVHVSGHNSTALRFKLPEKQKQCFFEPFGGVSRHIFFYEVIGGGNLDVDVTIYSPNSVLVYSASRKNRDTMKFESSLGTYTICFSNEFSSITQKVVYFELRSEESPRLALEAGKKIPTVNTQRQESLENIHVTGSKIMEYQTEYRLKEARGRRQADSLNDKVHWWGGMQTLAILLCSLGQVIILKTLFYEKRVPTKTSEITPELTHTILEP